MHHEKYIFTKGTVNLRTGAGTDSKIIKNLQPGIVLRVLEQAEGTWYKARVEADGTVGYITSLDKYVGEYIAPHMPIADKIKEFGETYLDVNYEFGSNRNTTTTFDCSDFTKHIYGHYGYKLGADSRAQSVQGIPVASLDDNDLRKGDLIFFVDATGRVYHVAMFIGDDKLLQTFSTTSDVYNEDLHKTGGKNGVTFSDFSEGSYWRKKPGAFARRVLI